MVIVNPLHHYFRPDHLEHVVGEIEGTHRLRAAKVLGVVPVLVHVRWTKGVNALVRARARVPSTAHSFDRVVVRGAT